MLRMRFTHRELTSILTEVKTQIMPPGYYRGPLSDHFDGLRFELETNYRDLGGPILL